jgi:hypothetical protein
MYIMSQKIHVKSWRLSGRDDSAKTQKMAREIQTPALDDFHIHLRQGRLMQTVTEHLRDSGVKLAYVMVGAFFCISKIASIYPSQRLIDMEHRDSPI